MVWLRRALPLVTFLLVLFPTAARAQTCPDADQDLYAVCGGCDPQGLQCGDCNDLDASVNPGAAEECNNGIDDDCDTLVDAGDPECVTCADADSDGFAECNGCTPGTGVQCGDCDDSDNSVNPNAPEDCMNGLDEDCDGLVDANDPDCTCPDVDQDGHADAACGGDDCDDSDPNVSPSAPEQCANGVDDDCDTLVDGGDPDCVTCPDDDLDGFVDCNGCTPGGGATCGDCDDQKAAVNPNEPEVCTNTLDDDCDGLVDGNDPDCGGCQDADQDGYGDSACGGSDCDDSDPTVWSVPGETTDLFFSDPTHLEWTPVADLGGHLEEYDTIRSDFANDFSLGNCVETDDPDHIAPDASVPAPSASFFYLVRAGNQCGEGTLGTDSGGTTRAGPACP